MKDRQVYPDRLQATPGFRRQLPTGVQQRNPAIETPPAPKDLERKATLEA